MEQQEENKLDDLSFYDLWLEYEKYMKVKLKKQSYRKEYNNYKNHILPYFKDYLVKDITAKDYLGFMNVIEDNENNYKYSFKTSLHTCMVSILNYAIKFYDLKDNIASKVGNFNKNKREIKNIDFWTYEEYQKFISVIEDELYKIFFNTLYFTGMRIGEITALNWNDFNGDYLDVNKTLSKELDEEDNYIINPPKTFKSIRKIKLDNDLIKSLKKLYSRQKKMIGFNDNWFIFGGKKALAQTTITNRKNKYCKIAEVKKIRLHDFRHSHATLLLSQGVPITVISQRLGHSDIAMTLNTYSHLMKQDEDKAINIINCIKSNNPIFN